MKRNRSALVILSTFLIAATLLSGCTKKKKQTDKWFEDHGLTISAERSVAFSTMQYLEDKEGGEFETKADVTITETPASVDGYKVVSASFTYDITQKTEGYKVALWLSAFDRYTGTSFEFDSESAKDNSVYNGNVVFTANGKKIDIQMEYGYESRDEEQIKVFIRVTCPSDYDGTVFQIGYSDLDIVAKNSAIDYTKPHTIDELPGYDKNGHAYYYFSYKNT